MECARHCSLCRRLVACQTRLSLPPEANLDSLIQSFASNSELDDPPAALPNSSLNMSQIRRKLFTDEDDLFDDPSPPPRRSSSFDVSSPNGSSCANILILVRTALLQSKSVPSSSRRAYCSPDETHYARLLPHSNKEHDKDLSHTLSTRYSTTRYLPKLRLRHQSKHLSDASRCRSDDFSISSDTSRVCSLVAHHQHVHWLSCCAVIPNA